MAETAKQGSSLWYTRRDDKVQGPFPAGLIRRYVILGRIRMDDELSQDLETWAPLSGLPALIPDILREQEDDPHAQERLMAARRWEDERGIPEAIDEPVEEDGERRHPDSYTGRTRGIDIAGAAHNLIENSRQRMLLALAVTGVIVMAFVVLSLVQPEDGSAADCQAPAQPGINWDNCAMEGRVFIGADLRDATMTNMSLTRADLTGARLGGADLSFSNLSVSRLRNVDLRGARLMGTNLRASDLSGAVLEQADLSYADLRNANLGGAQTDGARFDNAIWVDGVECLPGSIGACLTHP